ncbi:hypothetical protein LJK87_21795 [Paenibacillus sp. P25]|nr:hypothetical protein LJK87_21795 [Paenibacillus sp. P25]
MKQDTLRNILSRYRLVWNNIFSIAILVADDGELYLNTSENYQITPEDLQHSLLLKEVASPNHTGLAWSVNDALTKKTDMITFARKIYGVSDPRPGHRLRTGQFVAERGSQLLRDLQLLWADDLRPGESRGKHLDGLRPEEDHRRAGTASAVFA